MTEQNGNKFPCDDEQKPDTLGTGGGENLGSEDDDPEKFYGDGTEDDQSGPEGDSGDGADDEESTVQEKDLDDLLDSADSEQLLLPVYRCFKKVCALNIIGISIPSIEDGSAVITPEEGYPPIPVDGVFMEHHKPVVGGYLMFYEDGYLSFSPAEPFENGYHRMPRAGTIIDRKFEFLAFNPITKTVITEHNGIVFAAKDAALLKTLATYLDEAETIGCSAEHAESFRMMRDRVVGFQESVGCRVPDTVGEEVDRCIKGKGL